jgi:hypothetical protein
MPTSVKAHSYYLIYELYKVSDPYTAHWALGHIMTHLKPYLLELAQKHLSSFPIYCELQDVEQTLAWLVIERIRLSPMSIRQLDSIIVYALRELKDHIVSLNQSISNPDYLFALDNNKSIEDIIRLGPSWLYNCDEECSTNSS